MMLRNILQAAERVNLVAYHMLPVAESLGAARSDCLVLPFGIEIDAFAFPARPIKPGEPIRVICTRPLDGRIYDIATCLAGIAHARSLGADVRLLLAGRGSPGPWREQARKLDIVDAVTFLGGFTRYELPKLLVEHSVYLSASRSDGASVSLMEALAAGLVPVVSDIPANREWLSNGDNAVLFSVGSGSDLGHCLKGLPERIEWISSAVLTNRALVEARANRRTNLARWLRLLEEMSESGRVATGKH